MIATTVGIAVSATCATLPVAGETTAFADVSSDAAPEAESSSAEALTASLAVSTCESDFSVPKNLSDAIFTP